MSFPPERLARANRQKPFARAQILDGPGFPGTIGVEQPGGAPLAKETGGVLGDISTKLSTIDGRVDGLEGQLTTLAGYLDGVETLLTTQAGYLDGLETALASLNTAIGTQADAAWNGAAGSATLIAVMKAVWVKLP